MLFFYCVTSRGFHVSGLILSFLFLDDGLWNQDSHVLRELIFLLNSSISF